MKNGSDNNTSLDNCDNSIAVGESLSFTQVALQPTPLDSITPPSCAPDVLQLVFEKPIQCSSIAADGSDFVVTGPYPVFVTGASGLCDANGKSDVILVKLSAPMVTAGDFRGKLGQGQEGKRLLGVVGDGTP